MVVVIVLVFALFMALRPANLQAAIVPALNSASGSAGFAAILDNHQVMSKLAELGYNRDQVKELLANLSPEQRADLEQRVNLLRSGGNGLGLIIVVLLVVLVVVLLTGAKHTLKIEAQ